MPLPKFFQSLPLSLAKATGDFLTAMLAAAFAYRRQPIAERAF